MGLSFCLRPSSNCDDSKSEGNTISDIGEAQTERQGGVAEAEEPEPRDPPPGEAAAGGDEPEPEGEPSVGGSDTADKVEASDGSHINDGADAGPQDQPLAEGDGEGTGGDGPEGGAGFEGGDGGGGNVPAVEGDEPADGPGAGSPEVEGRGEPAAGLRNDVDDSHDHGEALRPGDDPSNGHSGKRVAEKDEEEGEEEVEVGEEEEEACADLQADQESVEPQDFSNTAAGLAATGGSGDDAPAVDRGSHEDRPPSSVPNSPERSVGTDDEKETADQGCGAGRQAHPSEQQQELGPAEMQGHDFSMSSGRHAEMGPMTPVQARDSEPIESPGSSSMGHEPQTHPQNLHQSPVRAGLSPAHSDGPPMPYHRPPSSSYHPAVSQEHLPPEPEPAHNHQPQHLHNLQYSIGSQYPGYNHNYFNNANSYNGQSSVSYGNISPTHQGQGFPPHFPGEMRGLPDHPHNMYMNQNRAHQQHESHHSSHIKSEFGHPLAGMPNHQHPRGISQDPYSFSDEDMCSPPNGRPPPFGNMGYSNIPMPLIAPKPKKPRKPRKPKEPKPDEASLMQLKSEPKR